jgi:hypothetical protein
MNHKDEFDSLLDEALSQYHNAEPLTGLEERVLQRLQLQGERQRNLWWNWGAAAICATMAAIALWLGVRERTHTVVLPSRDTMQTSPQTFPQVGTNQQFAQSDPRRGPATPNLSAKAAPPRVQNPSWNSVRLTPAGVLHPAQFPTATPLSSEEHALLALAQTHPEILLALGQQPRELSIKAIQIKPLAAPQADAEGESR